MFYPFPRHVPVSSVQIKEDNGSDSEEVEIETRDILEIQSTVKVDDVVTDLPKTPPKEKLDTVEDLDKELEAELNELAEIL